MAVRVTVDYHDRPAAMLKRAEKAARGSMLDSAKVWHRRFLPIHFTTAAWRRYDYTPRTKRYEIRKARTKRHRRPLVFSGRTRDMVRQAVFAVRKSKGEHVGTARMPVPPYFFKHPYRKATGKFIDKPAELTAIAGEEEQAFAELARRRVLRSLGENPERLRVTLK